ncbi:MAG TPA: DUF222 domain-containing protein [Acidimicrobiia bacterium]|nr:DUF222 domain-containing protein [Acidimicrobiia bacterium]
MREAQHKAACLPLERLEAEITTLAGHLAAAECRWLLMVSEFDRRKGYEQWGCWCASQWLGLRCGLEERAAREKVRVARALDDLPAITEAFATGQLSYSQVRALTRVAEPATEADLLMIARHATAAQLERLVRSYRGVLRREGETDRANERHARRYLSYHWDDDGSLVGSFRLDPEEGAVLVAAVESTQSGSAEPPEDDPTTRSADRPAAARRADALTAIARSSFDNEATPASGDRYQVVVHVEAPVLTDDAEGRCELANGPALAPETARRLACDASSVTMVDGHDGSPLDVGRRTRRIPPRLRRAVLARDGVCVFPGCDRPITEIHHRKHWAHGGSTKLTNLDGQCKFHHRLLHEGGWSIERDGTGRLTFRRPDGTILETTPIRAEPVDAYIETGNRTRGLTISFNTCVPRCYGDPLDLDWTIAGLCEAREHAAP